jgi:antitoxin component YwqK of YwqJK toxin-antitoxin module
MTMKHVCALLFAVLLCAAGLAEEPKKADDEEYLKYAIPDDAKISLRYPKPTDYAVAIVYKVEDKLVGERRYWDREQTKIHSEHLFKGEKEHGLQRAWHKNGELKSESPYRDGKMHGTFKQWDEKGKLLGSFVMKAGTGTFQAWYPNGQPHHIWPFRSGKEDGELRTFFETGKLFQVITYKEAKPHGVSYVWNRDGELEDGYPIFFVNGTNVTKDEYLKAAKLEGFLPPIKDPESFR